MFKYFEFNLKGISLILLYLLPISLLTGPAIPDISITIIGIFFITDSIIRKELEWLSEKWIISGLALWVAFILISFFAIDIKNSLQNAIIFIRYVMFSAAVSYWLLKERKQFIFFLQILSITLIFIVFDCFYQLINYNSLEGFGKDIFGFTSNHYGRLSGPFNDDVAGAHISRFLFFTILLFLLKRNNFYLNNLTFILFISLSSYIIWLSGEAMAIATTF
ncbi:hypothetical protein PQZ42_05630, partial [Alphaproteobacteria bacterium]|nr:hypothetical protein [Alphaproteobacteria bacterium]